MRSLRCSVFAAVLFAGLAACATSGGGRHPDSSSGSPVSIGSAHSADFGTILVGADGMPLYTHAGDSATESTCSGSCADSWPPLTVASGQQGVGAPGVDGTFGTLSRDDSTLQVTYNGLPLYYYGPDTEAAQPTGDGIDSFTVARP